IVARVAGTEQWAPQAGLESLYGGLIKDRIGPSGRSDSQVCHGFLPFWLLYVSESGIIAPAGEVYGVRSVGQLPCVRYARAHLLRPSSGYPEALPYPILRRMSNMSPSEVEYGSAWLCPLVHRQLSTLLCCR